MVIRLGLQGRRFSGAGRWIVRVRARRLAAEEEDAVLTVLMASNRTIAWDIMALSERRLGTPPTVAIPAARSGTHPRRPRAPAPPEGLRIGDRLTVAARLGPSVHPARIENAVIEHRPPAESLSTLLRRHADTDLDDPKNRKRRGIKRHYAEIKHQTLRPVYPGNSVEAVLRLADPDGVHWIRMQVTAINDAGESFQRERSFHILVNP